MAVARYSVIGTLASLSLVLAAGSVSAQSNTITIEQTGVGNTLSVDQSAASNSSVGGLTFAEGDAKSYTDSSDPGLSATLNPLTVTSTTGEAATQTGGQNSASIEISGDGGNVFLNQNNSGGGSLGNIASIGLTGDGAAVALGQLGLKNEATINVSGALAKGTILQDGDYNKSNLSVTGSGAEGFISQKGNNNDTGTVNVSGVNTSVTYIQQGNNLSPAATGQGVSVISNAAAVTITQTSFGNP